MDDVILLLVTSLFFISRSSAICRTHHARYLFCTSAAHNPIQLYASFLC